MIQRIQSLYLSFVILLSMLFFCGNVFSFVDESGKILKFTSAMILTDSCGHFFAHVANRWPLTLILAFLSFLSLSTILMFGNRKIQLWLAISVIVLSSVLIIVLSCYTYLVMDSYKMTIIPGFKMLIPLVILLFSILAYRGILKDDRLVKSYDRLR
jgi:hypothetical protein